MKSKFLALMLLAGSAAFAEPRVFFGISVGGGPRYYAPPPPPPPPVAYVAPAPGPGFVWINGYYAPVNRGWAWRPGYWARRPYPRAYWVGPRYERNHYYPGYWHR